LAVPRSMAMPWDEKLNKRGKGTWNGTP